MKRMLVNKFDHLGIKPQLYFLANERYTSVIGASMTILLVLSFIIITTYFFIIYSNGYGMSIISSIENVNTDLTINFNDKIFMLKYYESEKLQDPRISSLSLVFITSINGIEMFMNYPLEPCQYGRHFTKEKLNSIAKNIDISQYLCSNPENNLTLYYNFKNNYATYLSVLITRCYNETDIVCLSQEDIEFNLQYGRHDFSFIIENTNINHYNKTSPLGIVSHSSTFMIDGNEIIDRKIYCKKIDYKSDVGMLWNNWKNFEGFQFDNSLSQAIIRENDNDYIRLDSFASIDFRLSQSVQNTYEREFPKITSIIVDISSIAKIALIIAEFITQILSTGLYYVSVFKLSKLKTNEFLTIKLANNSIATVNNNNQKRINHNMNNSYYNISMNNNKNNLNPPNLSNNNTITPLNNNINYLSSFSYKEKKIKESKSIKYYRVSYMIGLQWSIFPKLTKRTWFIQTCKNIIAKYLGVDYIIKNLMCLEDQLATSNETSRQFLLSSLNKSPLNPKSNLAHHKVNDNGVVSSNMAYSHL